MLKNPEFVNSPHFARRCARRAAHCLLQALAWQPATTPRNPLRSRFPSPPGGSADMFARIVGEGLSRKWGQPVIVDNKPGAGGVLATQAVARLPSDGLQPDGGDRGHAINPHLYSKLPYEHQQGPDASWPSWNHAQLAGG